MSGTIYSYKPASATGSLEGASTVLTLKTGELLELRRGAKTKWSVLRDPAGTEPQKRWASLEEWKATLPEGATVTVHGDPVAETASVTVESDDLRRLRARPWMCVGSLPRLKLHTNKLDASRLMAKCRVAERKRDRTHYAASLRKYDAAAKMYRQQAEGVLAAAPYRHFSCRYSSQRSKTPWLMARRADGVFIPLFIDPDRNLFFTPAQGSGPVTAAATLAELGLEPVFLVRTELIGLRMESL
jgi:hypothetical protein